ncbi:MAG: D-alanyl-D-alanine carboxypeptidase [Nioella sp.]|nr:D-alanyl-D-alanine carboxypeptidase [Nioella sp.]
MFTRLSLALTLFLGLLAAPLHAFETQASAAYVIDHNTGQVLLDVDADVPLPPASMSKLMTINMVFEALEDGRLTLDTMLPVSQEAMDYGGSTMFLTTRDRVSVEDLLRGVIVLSGNDASAVLAEALSPDGTEAGFADLMTQRARQLGMMNSTFRNSNGWPELGHVMSVRDLGILAQRLITEFPQYYPYFSETEFAFDGRAPDNRFNRNPLLALGIGADGLKTGHTEAAGYGLVGSAQQGDRRVTFVIAGLPSAEARAREAERIVNWSFRQFAEREVVAPGTLVTEAEVFLGNAATVGLETAAGVTMLLPALIDDGVEAEAVFTGPIPAPIAEGQELGYLVIRVEGFEDRTVPLLAAESVGMAGFMDRLRTAADQVMQMIRNGTDTLAAG